MAFFLLAALAWFRYTRTGYVLFVLFFVLGAMAKPSVMTLPVLIGIVEFLVIRRVRWLRYPLPLLLSVGLAVSSAWAQGQGGALTSQADVPVWWKVLNAAASVGVYLRNAVWPQNLGIQHLSRFPAPPAFLVPGLVICAGLGWAAYGALREGFDQKRFAFAGGAVEGFLLGGFGWFLVAVGPMLGLIGFGGHAFADRFTYIPAVGLSLALAGFLAASGRRFFLVFAAVAVLALGFRARHQAAYWGDDGALWAHTLETDSPRNVHALGQCALDAFEVKHDLPAARSYLERAFEAKEEWSRKYGLLYLVILYEQGDAEAIPDAYFAYDKWFRRVYGYENSVNQGVAEAIYMLRDGGVNPERRARGEEILSRVAEARPDFPELVYVRYLTALKAGCEEEARRIRERIVGAGSTLGGDPYLRFRFLR